MTNEFPATVIDVDVEIRGVVKIKGEKGFIVRGLVEGEIESNGLVSIDEGGIVHGSIFTRDLIVSGRVETELEVSILGLLTVRKGGVLIASKISYGDLNHEAGARMSGQLAPCEHVEVSASQEASQPSYSRKEAPRQNYGGHHSSSDFSPNQHSTRVEVPKAIESVQPLPFSQTANMVDDVGQTAFSPVRELEQA